MGATLASLQAQTLPDWEAFLIDDASQDGSVALARAACAADPRLHLIHDPAAREGRGVAATRNLGIDRARGHYVAFLDADDLWLPSKLAIQAKAFDQGAEIVFSAYRRIGAAGRNLGVVQVRPRVTWEDALCGNPIGCLTGTYRRASFAQARMRVGILHEDYAFWLDLMRDGGVAIGLPQTLAEYRVRRGSVSANKLRSAFGVWHILGQQGIGMPRRMYGFVCYVVTGLTRRAGALYARRAERGQAS